MLHLFGFKFVQNCEIYRLPIMFVADFSACPSAVTVAASEDVHSEKTCLHSDGLSPSTAPKSNKLMSLQLPAVAPTTHLQKLLISRMCSF